MKLWKMGEMGGNYYLLTAGCDCSKCRIDVIEILIINKKPFIRQIINVF